MLSFNKKLIIFTIVWSNIFAQDLNFLKSQDTIYSFTSSDTDIANAVMNSITAGQLKYLTPLDGNEGNNILSSTQIRFTNQ